jgi:predicted O-linked N-acetylglucosamine transferase (SPINDLY family)
LRETMQQSSLLDAVTFTSHLEAAYQQMWYRYIQETT